MLIRFSVSNFRSIREKIELDMLATKIRSHKAQVHSPSDAKLSKLLRGAIIFGANASGKSNLVKSIRFAKEFIVRGRPSKKPINIPFFKLDEISATIPSRFEFEIQTKGEMYAYGFEIDNTYVHQEWLYRLLKNKEELIFERKADKNTREDQFNFGKKLEKLGSMDRQNLKFVARGTRENQLFLTESIDRNLDYFDAVYQWFSSTLKTILPDSKSSGISFRIDEDREFKDFLSLLLKDADFGIEEIATEELRPEQIAHLPPDQLTEISTNLGENEIAMVSSNLGRNVFLKRHGELIAKRLSTTHKRRDLATSSFSIEDESDGTQRLIDLSPALFEMTQTSKESVYVIDEIDRSLHPELTKNLILLHLEPEESTRSQLIVTTHETTLLDTDIIRRDQFWFMEKNECGESVIFPFSDFKNVRKDKVIRKDYLLGRFGGVPHIDFKYSDLLNNG